MKIIIKLMSVAVYTIGSISSGQITITQTSRPAASGYGYTGEYQSPTSGLVYLRARHYSPAQGRFISRDTWMGDYTRPLSLNRWAYVEGNITNLHERKEK